MTIGCCPVRSRVTYNNKFDRMLRHLAVALFPLIGDLSYFRVWVALICGLGVVGAIYWLCLPIELPLWPGITFISLVGVGGLVWETRSSEEAAAASARPSRGLDSGEW